MEHKLIQGGDQYLPFARSKIKSLRATGLEYASQRYILQDGEVSVKIAGSEDFISINGTPNGGNMLFQFSYKHVPESLVTGTTIIVSEGRTWVYELDKIEPMDAAKAKLRGRAEYLETVEVIYRYNDPSGFPNYLHTITRSGWTNDKVFGNVERPYVIVNFTLNKDSAEVRIGIDTTRSDTISATFTTRIYYKKKVFTIPATFTQSYSADIDPPPVYFDVITQSGQVGTQNYQPWIVASTGPGGEAVETMYFFGRTPQALLQTPEATLKIFKFDTRTPETVTEATVGEAPLALFPPRALPYTEAEIGYVRFGPDWILTGGGLSNIVAVARNGDSLGGSSSPSAPAVNRAYRIQGIDAPVSLGGDANNTLQLRTTLGNTLVGKKLHIPLLKKAGVDPDVQYVLDYSTGGFNLAANTAFFSTLATVFSKGTDQNSAGLSGRLTWESASLSVSFINLRTDDDRDETLTWSPGAAET